MSIIEQLNKCGIQTIDATCDQVLVALINALSNTLLKNDDESEKLCDFEELVKEFRCKQNGSCTFEYDMCGFWGHKYCVCCGKAQYPKLIGMRCSEANQFLNGKTEEEYSKSEI